MGEQIFIRWRNYEDRTWLGELSFNESELHKAIKELQRLCRKYDIVDYEFRK